MISNEVKLNLLHSSVIAKITEVTHLTTLPFMSAYRPPSAIHLLPHTSKCVYLQDDIDRGMLSAREILIVKKLSKYVWYGASPNAKNMLHFGDIFPCIPIMAAPPEIRLTMAQTRPCFFQTRVAGFRVCNQFSTPSVLDALAWSFFAQILFFQSLILKKRKKISAISL